MRLIVFWYPVAGAPIPVGPLWIPVVGYHAGIILIDNVKGETSPAYSFAGGPERRRIFPESLVSKSGPWKPGLQDYGKWSGGGVILLDNQAPLSAWIDLLDFFERDMAGKTVPYDPVPGAYGPWGNSNSWAAELLTRAGLSSQFDKAVKKRGGVPWLPGWGKKLWE